MKKFIAFILCFMYVVTSSGATINFHYCMGKLIGWDVTAPSSANCSNCGMHKEQKKGCCNDKHATFQLKKDQLASTINNIPNNFFSFLHHQNPVAVNSVLSIFIANNTRTTHIPPLIKLVSAFILNCVFLI